MIRLYEINQQIKMKRLITWLVFIVIAAVASSCKAQEHEQSTADTIHVYYENGVYKADLTFPIDRYPLIGVVVDSSNFWRPGEVDPPDPPDPPTTDYDFEVDTEAELTAAADQATSGEVVAIKNGTYRVTVVPRNHNVTFQAYPGHTPVISGLNPVTSPWVVHSNQIYKTSVTLPVNGYNTTISNNTTLAANQVFKNGVMMIEARWPDISTPEDLFDRNKVFRGRISTQSWSTTHITDSGIPQLGANYWNGAKLYIVGWFIAHTVNVTGNSGTTINFSSP